MKNKLNLDKINIINLNNTIMEKSKLMAEAIEAFKVRYGELPADAGWPVVREFKGSVYFSRSKEDWERYKRDYNRFNVIVKGVCLLIAAVLAAIIGLYLYFGSVIPLLFGGVAYAVVLFICAVSVYFFTGKKVEKEIKEYDGYKKKFYSISI